MTEQEIRSRLLDYAWLGPLERDRRIVDCIMSQDDWKYLDDRAEQYAGAQFEPGPKAREDGELFALTALYECHDGPHISTCPHYKNET